jgi:hypothetical protein
MFAEAGELDQVVDRLILAVREYLEYAERRRVGEGEARQFVEGLARELGFGGIRDFALYLWWLIPSKVVGVMEGLVVLGYAERRGPYVDVLSVRCVLPHGGGENGEPRKWRLHTTMDLPRFLRALVTHFKYVHGLTDWRQVAKWVIDKPWRDQVVDELGSEEGELGSEDWERLTPSLRLYLFEDVLGMLVEVLASLGLVIDLGHNEYKCVLDGVIVRGRYNLFKHLRNEHRELGRAVKLLLEALASGARTNGVEGEGGGVAVDEGSE